MSENSHGILMTFLFIGMSLMFYVAMSGFDEVRDQIKTNQTITLNELSYKCERVK